MEIILGSSSPRRKSILKKIINDFDIRVPDIDEKYIEGELPAQYAARLSGEKAESLVTGLKIKDPFLLISCDTIVALEKLIIGKPIDYNDARQKLKMLSGKTHEVISSITMISNYQGTIKKTDSEISFVTFKNIDDRDIEEYLEKIDYKDKAGAYAVQESGDLIIEKIDGSVSNVIGFPLKLFYKMLGELNLLDIIFK